MKKALYARYNRLRNHFTGTILSSLRRLWQGDWRDSILLAVVLPILWLLCGVLISNELFDSYYADLSKVLGIDLPRLGSLEESLGYIGILSAVQIPVFILLLEEIRGAGYIHRIVLPRTIRFREVIIGYILLSFLLAISPRTAFCYLPVIFITAVSFYAVFQSIRILFEFNKIKNAENRHIRQIIRNAAAFDKELSTNSSRLLSDLEKAPYITHVVSDLWFGDDGREIFSVRTKKAGILRDVDVVRLNDIIGGECFSDGAGLDLRETKSEDAACSVTRLIIDVRPGAYLRRGQVVMRLIMDSRLTAVSGLLESNLLSCLSIAEDHPGSLDRQMSVLIKDFRQHLRKAVEEDNEDAVDDALEIHEILISTLLEFREQDGHRYGFEDIYNQFGHIFRDEETKRLESAVGAIDGAFRYALRTGLEDAAKSLSTYMYKFLLDAVESSDILTAACAELIFRRAMSSLIYSDKAEFKNGYFRDYMLRRLAFRMKEHTGLLMHDYRKPGCGMLLSDDEVKDWIKNRLHAVTLFLLDSYRCSNTSMFSEIKTIFDEVDSDYHLHDKKTSEIAWMARCRMFMVAAYVYDQSEQTNGQQQIWQVLKNYLQRLSAHDITKILVESIDYDYARKWHFDVRDLPANGKMHKVPDFSRKIKSLWIYLMLSLDDFPDAVAYYETEMIVATSAFRDSSDEEEESFIIRKINEGYDKYLNAEKLRQLVRVFVDEHKKHERETLVAAEIDTSIVSEFKKDVVEGYAHSALALSLMQAEGALQECGVLGGGSRSYGWNQIWGKEGFIKNCHVGVIYNARELGEGMARFENRVIVEGLIKGGLQKKDSFKQWIGCLRGDARRWFIVSVRVPEWHMEYDRDDIRRESYIDHETGGMYFNGVEQPLPVYHIHDGSLERGLYAVPRDSLGKLKIKVSEDHPVELSIDAYSHNKKILKDILTSPPDWLQSKGDTGDQAAFLKTQVRVLIRHSFKYSPPRKHDVLYCPVPEHDDES